MGPRPPPGWRVDESRIAALRRGGAVCKAPDNPLALAGVGPYVFGGRRMCASLPDQSAAQVGLVGPLPRASLRVSCHNIGNNKHIIRLYWRCGGKGFPPVGH